MDQMLPSPGFSIPSIGTPLHQPDDDQQILPTALQQQQDVPQLQPQSSTDGLQQSQQQQHQPPHLQMSSMQSPMPAGMMTPHKSIFGMGTFSNNPHAMMQPQTPIHSLMSPMLPSSMSGLAPMSPMGPGLHGPMTPMTPVTPCDPTALPQLQNIVSTVNLSCKLDLKKIALHARNAEYNPKRFAAVIMRIREPRTTALIFTSGKMVCTGAKSEEDSRLAARKYARIIQKLGFPAKFLDFKIQNIVGSCDVKFPIRLEGLVLTHGQFSSYEPELFPGLIYRMVKPRIVLLIFVSGKVVLTGAKVRQEIYEAFDNIYPILKSFKKQ
ncbi:unnamed protein product [Trichogramma brassicae]|uniref:TATA-box-binding protein n=1 Tax=Trichogramma brassicae TaxID=86971 RepID=A0A6H5I621_9HYME|nr:unnamed protein product [Trichogramma brassicae]